MCKMFFRTFENDAEAIQFVKERKSIPYTDVCFSDYTYKVYEGIGNMYFGFYADERISRFIETFNKRFSKIKIHDLLQKEFLFIGDIFYDKVGAYFGKERDEVDKYNFSLFRVEFSNEYSQKANFVLTLAIAQFLRIFCPKYQHYPYLPKDGVISINKVVNAFNSASNRYGTWAYDHKFTVRHILWFMKPEVMNNICEDFSDTVMPRNSKLVERLDRLFGELKDKKEKK